MIRRIISSLLLLLLTGIYALPLSAGLLAKGPDCCTDGMCARPGHTAKQTNRSSMPKCPMHSQSSKHADLQSCSCRSHDGNVIGIGLYVLPFPARFAVSLKESPVSTKAVENDLFIRQLPETPPPRIPLS
jgi:hypothetical protein